MSGCSKVFGRFPDWGLKIVVSLQPHRCSLGVVPWAPCSLAASFSSSFFFWFFPGFRLRRLALSVFFCKFRGFLPGSLWISAWQCWGLFPECVARVPVSLWGSGSWGCVRSTLRSRSQPSATVRNRSYELRMAVPMGSFAEVVLSGGFRRVVASFRVADVALRGIQTCSATCRKSFCVAGAILLWRFQKMCCSFRGRRSTLDVSIVIFRGRRSTLDVSSCVFFANRIGRAASSGDKVQIPWTAQPLYNCRTPRV